MKKLFFLLAMAIVLNGYSQTTDDDLILYLPLDGKFNDLSENEFHCISNADFVEDQFGNLNGAAYFNGFDRYIAFPPNQSTLKPQFPISFSYYVRFDDLSSTNRTIFRTDFDMDNYAGIWMNVTAAGNIAISFGDNTGNTSSSNRRSFIGTTYIATDNWYHVIAIIRDNDDMSIYLNCVEESGGLSGSAWSLQYTDCQGGIGRGDGNTGNPPNYFKGAIDEFMYWKKDISLTGFEGVCNEAPKMLLPINITKSDEEISVRPNPTNSTLFISNLPNDGFTINIYNTLGERIISDISTSTVDVSMFLPGIYVLRVSDSKGIIRKEIKFIKE